MSFRFPIDDIKIVLSKKNTIIQSPRYHTDNVFVTQSEFGMDVPDIAWFYASNGSYIEVNRYPSSNLNAVELYLNSSVYGAILHQRKTLPLHGSCFQYNGRGIMICGESGVGKSSLTAAFCIKGAEFLTDDVTPIVVTDEMPFIWAMSDRIKLWSDSLRQLNQSQENLIQVGPEWKKFYFPMESTKGKLVPLNHIFVLQVHDKPELCFQALEGLDKFIALRREIYRGEYLLGMPESEAEYLKKLTSMAKTLSVTNIFRPEHIPIEQVRVELEKHILEFTRVSNKLSV